MKEKLPAFFIKNRIQIFLVACGLLILLFLVIFIPQDKTNDYAIDLLVKPASYVGIDSYYDTDGYMNVICEKKNFHADDTIELTFRTAYFELLDDAQLTEYIRFNLVHSDYLEVEVAGASERTVRDNQLVPPYNDVDATYKITDFDPADLVYQPVGLFNRITRDSLQFTVEVTVKLKENAPQTFADELWIMTSPRKDQSVNADTVGYYTDSRVCIQIRRDGDMLNIETYTGLPNP